MKYMLLVCVDPSELIEATPGGSAGMSIDEWVDEMDGSGVRLDGERLAQPADAKTVRVRGGRVVTTDGPFAETKEIMAGYDIIEATSLEHAIEVASKHPMARDGMIEVRPFWQE
jgi:hypothetical protein